MALTWPVVLAVLGGAVLHAGWNALVKSSGDKALDTALVHFLGAVVALPLLAIVGLPPTVALPFIAASLVIHIGYYIALAGAYKHGELGLTYPIMRGFAPLLVALGSSAVLAEAPTPLAWAGILGITLGVALVGLAHPGETLHHRKALGFAFANALIIAVYTFVDGKGVRETVAAGHTAAAYVMLLFVLDGLPYPALVYFRRDAAGRRAILAYARRRWPLAALGGAASIGSYCDRAVGDDARTSGQRGGAARDLGAVRRAARGVAAEGEIRHPARPRHAGDRERRDGAAPRMKPPPAHDRACLRRRARPRLAAVAGDMKDLPSCCGVATGQPGRARRLGSAVFAALRLPCAARVRGPVAQLPPFASLTVVEQSRRVRARSALRARAPAPVLLGASHARRAPPAALLAPMQA